MYHSVVEVRKYCRPKFFKIKFQSLTILCANYTSTSDAHTCSILLCCLLVTRQILSGSRGEPKYLNNVYFLHISMVQYIDYNVFFLMQTANQSMVMLILRRSDMQLWLELVACYIKKITYSI